MASSISPEMKAYLANCTPEEISALLDAINALPKMKPGGKGARKASTNKITKTRASSTAAKRPLNSWMAFRAYYSPIFNARQQKDISGLLTTLWQADPFHAKWSILAKAYSIIRDSIGKEAAPLDAFLAFTRREIGIPSPEEYLELLGWEVTVNHDSSSGSVRDSGVLKLIRTSAPDAKALTERLQGTTLSVDDVVSYCCEFGYVDEEDLHKLSYELGNGSYTLTMAARPAQHTLSTASGSSPTTQYSQSPTYSGSTSQSPTYSGPTSQTPNHMAQSYTLPPFVMGPDGYPMIPHFPNINRFQGPPPSLDSLHGRYLASALLRPQTGLPVHNAQIAPMQVSAANMTVAQNLVSATPSSSESSPLVSALGGSTNNTAIMQNTVTPTAFGDNNLDPTSSINLDPTLSQILDDGDFLQGLQSPDPFGDGELSIDILEPLGGDNFDAFNISGFGNNSLLGNSMFWSYTNSCTRSNLDDVMHIGDD